MGRRNGNTQAMKLFFSLKGGKIILAPLIEPLAYTFVYRLL